MQIGILGAGNIGATVGKLLAQAGHSVRFGTRHPERLASLVAAIGPKATAGTAREAAEYGEVILMAVPLHAVPELAREAGSALAGKTVLDATNPYPDRDGEAARQAIAEGRGSSKWTASKLPGARVVKAFNMQRFDALQREAHHDEDPLAVVLAGDDLTAVAIAKQLVHDAGFEPVIVGSLEEGRAFDPGTAYYATNVRASNLRNEMADQAAASSEKGRALRH